MTRNGMRIEKATEVAGQLVSDESLAGITKVDITFQDYNLDGEMLFSVGIYSEFDDSGIPDEIIYSEDGLDKFYRNLSPVFILDDRR